jgi:hypothetical protein
MKVGDLVKTNSGFYRRGILVKRVWESAGMFNILWADGMMGYRVRDYDLEVISESR